MTSKYIHTVLLTCLPLLGWAQTGNITTIAGNGTTGSAGDGGPAAACELAKPYGIACATNGDIYISEANSHRVRKIEAATGNISLLANEAYLKVPGSMTMDKDGNIVIADRYRYRIRKVTPSGTVTYITNGGEGSSPDGVIANMCTFMLPTDVAYDAAGNLYIVDEKDHKVRRINAATNKLETVAGTGVEGSAGDGGPATEAQLRFPTGVDVDANGNVYIADNGNHRIRQVTPDGNIATIAGTTGGYGGDWGNAIYAKLFNPNDILVSGNKLFIADMNNNRVRMIDATGIITTVAGNGTAGYSGDGGNAASAQLYYPTTVARDAAGNLIIADQNNNRVRKVSGIVGVRDVVQDVAVSVYPNPATELVHIYVPANTYRSVSLLSSTGSLVMQGAISDTETELNIATLPAGIYHVVLRSEAQVTMKQLVKL